MHFLIIIIAMLAIYFAASPLVLIKIIEKLLFSMDAEAFDEHNWNDIQIFVEELQGQGLMVDNFRFFGEGQSNELNAVFIRNPNSAWVINFHMGKNNSIQSCFDFLRIYSQVASVLIVERRGWGSTGGTATLDTVLADARSARMWLLQQGFEGEQIIPAGDSLGSYPATTEALGSQAPAVILSAAYSSLIPIIRKVGIYTWLYPDWMFPKSLRSWNNAKNLAAMQKPVLILHGRYDDFIHFGNAQTLLRAAGKHATLIQLISGHRNTAGADTSAFEKAVHEFVSKLPAPVNASVNASQRQALCSQAPRNSLGRSLKILS